MKMMENYEKKAFQNSQRFLNQIQKAGMILQLHMEDFTLKYQEITSRQSCSKSLLYFQEKGPLWHVLRLFMIYARKTENVLSKMISLLSLTQCLQFCQTSDLYLYLNFVSQTPTPSNLTVTVFPQHSMILRFAQRNTFLRIVRKLAVSSFSKQQ